jgi:hypothetical protein
MVLIETNSTTEGYELEEWEFRLHRGCFRRLHGN